MKTLQWIMGGPEVGCDRLCSGFWVALSGLWEALQHSTGWYPCGLNASIDTSPALSSAWVKVLGVKINWLHYKKKYLGYDLSLLGMTSHTLSILTPRHSLHCLHSESKLKDPLFHVLPERLLCPWLLWSLTDQFLQRRLPWCPALEGRLLVGFRHRKLG